MIQRETVQYYDVNIQKIISKNTNEIDILLSKIHKPVADKRKGM